MIVIVMPKLPKDYPSLLLLSSFLFGAILFLCFSDTLLGVCMFFRRRISATCEGSLRMPWNEPLDVERDEVQGLWQSRPQHR